MPEPWLIDFIHRHRQDDPGQSTSRIAFLDTPPDKVAAEIQAVLEAVARAPPPSFSGGGKWEAMHGEMAGLYELRVQGRGANHRLFYLLERNADDLGGPSIVCLGGLSKPVRSAAEPPRRASSAWDRPSSLRWWMALPLRRPRGASTTAVSDIAALRLQSEPTTL